MAAFLDVCRFTPTAGGTTDWTVSSAVTGYQTPASAGAVDGDVYRYRAESSDLSEWEVGYGTYTVSGTVLSRTVVMFNSTGTTAKINFSSTPQVAIVALAEDIAGGDMLSTNNLSDVADAGTSMRNLGGLDVSTVVAVTTTTTLTSSAFGKLHLISGTSAYTVTLPTPVGNTGAIIALSVDNATNATKLYTISSPSGNVGRNTSLVMWAHEQLVIRSDGADWVIVSARQIPFVGRMVRTTNQTSGASTAIVFTATDSDPTGLNLAYNSSTFVAPRAGVYHLDVYAYQTQSGGSYNQLMISSSPFSFTGSLAAGTVYGSKALSVAAGNTLSAISQMNGTSPVIAAATVPAYLDYSEVVPSW